MQRAFTVFSILFFWLNSFGQTPEIVKTIIPQRNQDFVVSVEYYNDFKEHCNAPITYRIKVSGTIKKNTRMEWTYQYIPCNGTRPVKSTVSILLPKGTATTPQPLTIKTRNLITTYDDNSFETTVIEDPSYTVTGPSHSVMEGDEFTLHAQTAGAEKIKWIWSKGSVSKIILGENKNKLTQKLNATTTYYLRAETQSFKSAPQAFTVTVIKRPDAPSDFRILGPNRTITDIEPVTLNIDTDSKLEGVKWIWESGGQIVHEGLSYAVNPKSTTVYTVHSEYYGKRSVAKSIRIDVRVLPPAPENFSIVAPSQITEGKTAVMKVNSKEIADSVRWVWKNMTSGEEIIGDSIAVTLEESTTYELYADLNGKLSRKLTKRIEVIQPPVAPTVKGNFRRCASDLASRFRLEGGRLGTGGKNWNWYEGKCGAGKLIHTGSEVLLKPTVTTSYYVQADNSTLVCQQFTLEVGTVPALPATLNAPVIVCPGALFSMEATGTKPPGVEWNWYVSETNYSNRSFQGQGEKITAQLTRSALFTVTAKNHYCESNESRTVAITVKEASLLPSFIAVRQVKKRKYNATIPDTRLGAGSQWKWYDSNCGGTPVGTGTQISFRAKKTNTLFVRAEGTCETGNCQSTSFTYSKTIAKFLFANFGLSSNKQDGSITDYNAQLTLGSNRLYFRARLPFSKLLESSTEETFVNSSYKTDDNRITNYPAGASSYYRYNGNTYNEISSISAGLLIGGNVLKVYLGGGYGKRELYWGADIMDYNSDAYRYSVRAKHVGNSISGPIAEAGIFVRLKAINLMGGGSVIIKDKSHLYRDIHAGIGFNFNRN